MWYCIDQCPEFLASQAKRTQRFREDIEETEKGEVPETHLVLEVELRVDVPVPVLLPVPVPVVDALVELPEEAELSVSPMANEPVEEYTSSTFPILTASSVYPPLFAVSHRDLFSSHATIVEQEA